jgi:hypothetical protein
MIKSPIRIISALLCFCDVLSAQDPERYGLRHSYVSHVLGYHRTQGDLFHDIIRNPYGPHQGLTPYSR